VLTVGDGFWREARHVFSGVEKGGKKQPSTFILLALITLGIVFMFISSQPKQFTAPPPVAGTSEVIARPSAVPDYRETLERDLATLLRRVRGVGDVVVMVTMESGPVYEYAESSDVSARTTQEEDSGGGARQVTESTERKQPVIARTETNREAPLVIREMQPRVGGVIVIAEGAEDPVLREQLFRAVQASLNLAAHRITVLPMK
jgi:stage III sporulation protein AG